MSDITDWEPNLKPVDWERQYERQLKINEILIAENNTLLKKNADSENSLSRLQADYTNYKKSSEQQFRCLKAEIITSLRAIELCLIASLRTDDNFLTHRARNFRMRHVHQIIRNEVDRFGDRKLTTYDDDF